MVFYCFFFRVFESLEDIAEPCASKNNKDLLINCIGLLCLPRSDDFESKQEMAEFKSWYGLTLWTATARSCRGFQ